MAQCKLSRHAQLPAGVGLFKFSKAFAVRGAPVLLRDIYTVRVRAVDLADDVAQSQEDKNTVMAIKVELGDDASRKPKGRPFDQ
jgi:hypothetical protein